MAIKMTCPCGKRMAIDKQYIGRKIACPGCGKRFVLDRARLAALVKRSQQSTEMAPISATARPSSPAPIVTAAANPEPQPADLDQDILTLIHDDLPSGSLKLHDEVEPDAANAADTSLASGSPPSVVLVDEAVELTYAGAGHKGRGHVVRSETDAIQTAKHSFWVDLTLAFIYPVQSVGNLLTFIGLCVLALMHLVIEEAPWGGILMGPMMLMGWFAFYGWFCAFYMSVVIDTSAGSSGLPGIRIDGGWWEDVLKPGLLLILAQLIVFVPPILLYWILDSYWPAIIGLGVMLFLYPFIILLLSLSDASTLLRIDLIALTILRTLPAYALIFVLLTLANVIDFVVPATQILNARGHINLPKGHFLIAQNLGFLAIRHLFVFYVTAVCMRLIGLYYLHFKHKFAFEFE